MATKREWLKAAGVGLMGFQQQYNVNRKFEVEQRRADALNKIREGQLGLDKEMMGLRRTMNDNTVSRQARNDETTARDKVQQNFNALDLNSPENMDKRDYYEQRAMLMAQMKDGIGVDMGDLNDALAELGTNFITKQEANFTGTPEEQTAYKKRLGRHVTDVEAFFKTANGIMGRAVPGWSESGEQIEDFIYITDSNTRGLMDSDLAAVVAGDEGGDGDDTEALPPDESEPYSLKRVGDFLRGYESSPGPLTDNAARAQEMGFDRGISMTPEDAQYWNPATGRIERPSPPQPTRRLDVDPATGQLRAPGLMAQ